MKATTLPGRILDIVCDPQWGGGLHREHLAELVGYQPRDKDFTRVLMILYKAKRIDFCRNYVVATVNPKSNPKGTTP